MTWIRWDCDAPTSDVIGWLAEELGIGLAQALGHYTAVCCAFGQHMSAGHIADVPDISIEQWAMWEGERGVFAETFRRRCQDETGQLRGWWRQDKLLRRRELDRDRKRESRDSVRRTSAGRPVDRPQDVQPQTVRYDTEQGTTTTTGAGDFQPPPAFDGVPHREAVVHAIRASRNPGALLADLRARLDGMPGHQPATAAELAQALHEMAVAGAPMSPRAISRFVDGVRAGHAVPARASPGGRDFEAERAAREEARVQAFLKREAS